MLAMSRGAQPSLEKESNHLLGSAFPATEGDYACGASELSTRAMSSSGLAQLSTPSEADDFGAMMGTGIGAPDQQALWAAQGSTAAGSRAPPPWSAAKSTVPTTPTISSEIGNQIWRAVGGDGVLIRSRNGSSDHRTTDIFRNLRGMLATREVWNSPDIGDKQVQKRSPSNRINRAGGSPDRPEPATGWASPDSLTVSSFSNSPARTQNSAEAAVEALAAAKRAEASRLVVERLAEERILAGRLQIEDFAAERLATERLEGERLAAERIAAATEKERLMADRLQRCEAREACCEQQVAAEQSRVCLLRADLEAARRELESREKGNHAKLAEEFKAREVHTAAKTQCLETMHEDAQREVETLRLQHHVVEVDLGRKQTELAATNARQKVLEEELRLLKERPPKAPKSGAQRRAAGGKLLDRHELASRTAFAAKAEAAQDGKPAEAGDVHAAGKAESSWLLFGCCSTTKAGTTSTVSAKAPEPPSRPN